MVNTILITPAMSWPKCKKIAFDYYGDICIWTRKFPYNKLYHVVDPAHIFGRGAYPHMKLIPLNVIPLDRYIHTLIDNYMHPFSQSHLSADERLTLFRQLIGIRNYYILNKLALRI